MGITSRAVNSSRRRPNATAPARASPAPRADERAVPSAVSKWSGLAKRFTKRRVLHAIAPSADRGGKANPQKTHILVTVANDRLAAT